MSEKVILERFPKYEIYSDGRIFSKIGKGKFLKPSFTRDKYLYIELRDKDKKRIKFLVHRLVMLAFVGEDSREVNHIDWNKENNTLSNLEYCEREDNLSHRRFNSQKRFVTFNKNANKFQVQIRQGKTFHYLGLFEKEECAYSKAFDFYVKTFGKEPWSKNV